MLRKLLQGEREGPGGSAGRSLAAGVGQEGGLSLPVSEATSDRTLDLVLGATVKPPTMVALPPSPSTPLPSLALSSSSSLPLSFSLHNHNEKSIFALSLSSSLSDRFSIDIGEEGTPL